jgi:Flp pilus assembly protein TadG
MYAFAAGAWRKVARFVSPRCPKLVRRFRQANSGNVAVMFALVAVPLTAAIGLAIDMGRIYHIGLDTQGALDAAALAAGRVAQIDKSGTLTQASAAASAYFDQAKPTDVVETKINFAPNDQHTEFKVTATSWVRTPFLSVLHVFGARSSAADAPSACRGNYYACTKIVTTATAEICLNCGQDDGTNLEIALMLDLTGSMQGDKIEDLKAAAADLVKIVIWEDQSKWTSKVALAPFAAAVNVGPYFTQITGKADREDNDGRSSRNIHYPPECLRNNGSVRDDCRDNDHKYNEPPYIAKYATCVVERNDASTRDTDAPPNKDEPATLLPTWNDATSSMSKTCDPTAAIVPLTKERQTLVDIIEKKLATNGSTAGQLGTAFAWYLLSPKWAAVWPEESRPTPYGTPKTKKIAVLMTDGEYNTLQGKQYNDGSSQATTALDQAKTLCAGMKKNALPDDPNIEIFTVGFKLTTKASKAMLKDCATDASHYYETSTGDALKAAFRDIALRISKLRLTN